VVLVLTMGVFLVTRTSLPTTVEASTQQDHLTSWAGRVGRQARDFLPSPVLGTEDSAGGAASLGGRVQSQAPGFISTGLLAEADPTLLPWDEPQQYVVEEGDTITGIAAAYGIEPETLLYANPDLRKNPHFLSVGQAVTILPVNGVLHVVEEGDTIDSIAALYRADGAAVVSYTPNGLRPDSQLVAGAEIVVPGGEMDIEIPSYYQFVQGPSARSVWASDGGGGPVVGSGTFYRASYGRITSRFSRWHRGVDIANKTGTPIYAVDGGLVEVAGWYGWAGNAVIIDHGNGFESLYAHMSSFSVSAGQTVQKGQIIGAIGCTYGRGGRCSGPHLHLELYYQGSWVNPCNYGVCP